MSGLDVTFYTVSSARYFQGTVALLNSLRVSRNRGTLVVLDGGLSPLQRRRLAQHCFIADLPAGIEANLLLSKAFPYHLQPTGTVVLIDSDIIVTASLDDIVIKANNGKICAVPDPDDLRWYDEWQKIFNLASKPRRQTYLNSGFLAFSASQWPRLLERWWQACQRIPPDRVTFGRVAAPGMPVASQQTSPRRGSADPVADGDQDALNALLMSEFPTEALALEPAAVEVFHSDLSRARVRDARTLSCSYGGRRTVLLHHNGSPKPWESADWARVRRDAYVRLLPRVLLEDDVTLQLNQLDVPIWLRRGVRGRVVLGILGLVHAVLVAVLKHMPVQASKRVRRFVHRLVGQHTASR